jgi:hypothetical protein
MKNICKSTGAVPLAFLWAALFAFPFTVKAQGPDRETSCKKFLQAYFADKDPDKTTQYVAVFRDLNGDGKPEALVYITGPGWCGNGGCKLYVLTPQRDSWRIVAKTTITWPPIRVLAAKSHGWHDLGVAVGGTGYEAQLSFNGIKYPGNPSVPPARKAPKNAPGEVAISEAQKGKPLYP